MNYRPKELCLEITNKCFMNCIHCSSESCSSSEEYLSLDIVRTLLHDAVHLGVINLVLSGGEPLLHPQLDDIIIGAFNRGLKITMYSCGVLKEHDTLVPVSVDTLKRLKDLGLHKLIFSMHGTHAETHENITNTVGSFNILLHSILNARAAGLLPELHFVAMRSNYKQIHEFIVAARSLDIKKVSILRLVPQGRGFNDSALTRDEALYLVNKVRALSSLDTKVRLGAPFNCVLHSKFTQCTAGRHKLVVSADGRVVPCEAFKFLKGYSLSVYNYSLGYIWHEDKLFKEIRRVQIEGTEACNYCHFRIECGEGCLGQRLLGGSTLNAFR